MDWYLGLNYLTACSLTEIFKKYKWSKGFKYKKQIADWI